MESKRGWIIIIEAVIAVLILFGFLFTTIAKQTEQIRVADKEEYLYSIVNELAIKAEKNEGIRNLVLQNKCDKVKELVKGLINKKVNIAVAIENECGPKPLPQEKEIYTAEIIIATNSTNYEPKKLKIFIWE